MSEPSWGGKAEGARAGTDGIGGRRALKIDAPGLRVTRLGELRSTFYPRRRGRLRRGVAAGRAGGGRGRGAKPSAGGWGRRLRRSPRRDATARKSMGGPAPPRRRLCASYRGRSRGRCDVDRELARSGCRAQRSGRRADVPYKPVESSGADVDDRVACAGSSRPAPCALGRHFGCARRRGVSAGTPERGRTRAVAGSSPA